MYMYTRVYTYCIVVFVARTICLYTTNTKIEKRVLFYISIHPAHDKSSVIVVIITKEMT